VLSCVVVGSGPAGYTAAIYAGRASLRPVVFEGLAAGGVRGGQLMGTTEVENFPGFPEGVTGPDLMDRMRAQAARWGASLHTEDVEELDLSERPFRVRTSEREVRAHAVVLATGATARRLGLPSEERFWSRGISACAICDGASLIFRDAEVAVVGGGDSAVEEALYLTKYCSRVHLLVRGDALRASRTMAARAIKHPMVDIHYRTEVVDAVADRKNRMSGLILRDAGGAAAGAGAGAEAGAAAGAGDGAGAVRPGAVRPEAGLPAGQWKLPVRGLFYGIGHKPNSDLVRGQVELDEAGYVLAPNAPETSVPGLFAAGDLHDTQWRQAVTAAGSGCSAAIAAERYLAERDLLPEAAPAEAAAPEDGGAAEGAASAADEDEAATTEEDFDISRTRHKGQFALRKLYHESEKPLMVLYTSPGCGPCRSLKPMISGVVEEYENQIHFVEIDIEQDPEIALASDVMGTPVVQIFKDKARVETLNGVKMKKIYRSKIDAYV